MEVLMVAAMAVVLLAKTAVGVIIHIRARDMVQVVPNLQVEQEDILMLARPITLELLLLVL